MHGTATANAAARRADVRREFSLPRPRVRFRGGFSACYLLRRQLFSLPGFLDCAPPCATPCPRYSGKEIRNHDETWRMRETRRRKEGRKRRENRDEGEAHCRYIAGAVLSAPSIIQVARLTRCTAPHHATPRHTRVLINSSLYVCLIPGDPSTRVAQPVQLSPHVTRKIPDDRDIASLALDVSIFASLFLLS